MGWVRGIVIALGLASAAAFGADLELRVRNIADLETTQSTVVVLVDGGERRFLPIWIGPNEAMAIAMELKQIKPPRPMTHDLFATLVRELEARIDKIVITEIKSNTYIASLHLSRQGKTKIIDCRPSDGIAIALRAKAPILAADTVMDHALPLPEEARHTAAPPTHRVAGFGITAQTLTPDLAGALDIAHKRGVLVTASQHPRIQRGDLVLAVVNSPVHAADQLAEALAKIQVGHEVTLRIVRQGKTETITVRPLDQPAAEER